MVNWLFMVVLMIYYKINNQFYTILFINKGKDEEDRLFQIAKNHATNDSDKIILTKEIE